MNTFFSSLFFGWCSIFELTFEFILLLLFLSPLQSFGRCNHFDLGFLDRLGGGTLLLSGWIWFGARSFLSITTAFFVFHHIVFGAEGIASNLDGRQRRLAQVLSVIFCLIYWALVVHAVYLAMHSALTIFMSLIIPYSCEYIISNKEPLTTLVFTVGDWLFCIIMVGFDGGSSFVAPFKLAEVKTGRR